MIPVDKDNEVYRLGSDAPRQEPKRPRKGWWIAGLVVLLAAITAGIWLGLREKGAPDYYFEPESASLPVPGDTLAVAKQPYMELMDETVNDVPLSVYIPHEAVMSLSLGMPDTGDSTIVFAAQAADIRADNGLIVGDFVLAGERLAQGQAKAGFCAVIDGRVTLGMGSETPLLRQAMEAKGYFFRQYALVNEGQPVENNPKNKSIRRALAIRDGKVMVVASRSRESLHDFSQALADIGVTQAIYLVGSTTYGWWRDAEGTIQAFGTQEQPLPPNTTYIVWRKR